MGSKLKRRRKLIQTKYPRCFYCESAELSITLDHIIPQYIYRSNYKINFVGACNYCNSKRGRQNIVEFVEQHFPHRIDDTIKLVLQSVQRMEWVVSHDFKVPDKEVEHRYKLLREFYKLKSSIRKYIMMPL